MSGFVAGKGKELHAKRAAKSLARQQKIKRDKRSKNAIKGISKPEIRRLARRGGVQRIQGDVYETARSALRSFLKPIISDSIVYMEHARRKTICTIDVLHALKNNGRHLYIAQ